jgi:maltose/maltodextrin transport system substrate-binding protein
MKKTIDLILFSCGIIISLLCFSCTSEIESKHSGNIPGYYSNGPASNWKPADWSKFHHQAIEESMQPVRPGEPGKSPFWNGHAKRFIYVPSFHFNKVSNAIKYRYTSISDANGMPYSFEAKDPWSLLTPVWQELPVGIVFLKVEGLDADNHVIGVAGERMFYKAAAFKGPYNLPVTDYKSSVIRNMKSLLEQEHYGRWKTESIPSHDYKLYCYPSKIVGSIIQAMTIYSSLSDEDREDAMNMAENAAKYLLSLSHPAGSVLEFFPPTYLDRPNSTNVARERKDQLMMFYPALVGSAYLDLYEVTGNHEYLEASIKIAETYAKTQLPAGSWPLMVWIESGDAVQENLCVPTDIINFLDRLVMDHEKKQFRDNSDKAFKWIMENPMRNFHWEGQFEDMGYSKNYSNMERGKPFAFAIILLSHSQEVPGYIEMAEELIRFAEDQFVVWEQALPRELFRTSSRQIPSGSYYTSKWFTPCVLEQYGYYTPIDASSASAIFAYKKAYEITGKELYLAKAISLADNQTVAQDLAGGIYPTNQMDLPGNNDTDTVWTGWLNCATITARALLELNELVSKTE